MAPPLSSRKQFPAPDRLPSAPSRTHHRQPHHHRELPTHWGIRRQHCFAHPGDPTVTTTGTALTCRPNPIDIGNTAHLTATVTSANGTPTGFIAFTDNGVSLATQILASGAASLTYTGSSVRDPQHHCGLHPRRVFRREFDNLLRGRPYPSNNFCPDRRSGNFQLRLSDRTYCGRFSRHAARSQHSYGRRHLLEQLLQPSALALHSPGGVCEPDPKSLTGGSHSLTCMYGGSSIYATSNCNTVPIIVHPAPTVHDS